MKLSMRALRSSFWLLFLAICVHGQQVVAPTPVDSSQVRGDDWRGYNFVNSIETGYRFHTVDGNPDTYRSTVNFGNGVRLLSSYLTINSKNGHGLLFDQIVITTQGLGGDPYSSAILRVQKNRLYDYNFSWRRNEYFNPGLVTDGGAGQHLLDTANTLQNQDLTLFPQSTFRFNFGFTHNDENGPGISTVQLFDPQGNIFPFFANLKRVRNEYRIGNEIHWRGTTFTWTRGWENFKDDTTYNLNSPSLGDNPTSGTTLNSFARQEPYHGTSPYWNVGLIQNGRLVQVNGRFTYSSGSRGFFLNEFAAGVGNTLPENRQILSYGDARRPVATGNATLTFSPTERLSITNHTSVYNVRTEGDSTYLQFDNAAQSADVLYFQYLGIRTVATETDALYRLLPSLDLHGGYNYSNRRIKSVEQFTVTEGQSSQPYVQTNALNAGAFGVDARPLKGLSLSFDGEIGQANLPFTPKSDGNYQAFTGRAAYRRKNLQLATSWSSNYNATSVSVSSYSSQSRNFSASGSWTPRSWLGADVSYSKLHIDAAGGILFFADDQQLPSSSYYISNIHALNVGLRLTPLKRADFYVGYTRVQDTGDGRDNPTDTTRGPDLPAFQIAQTFPLTWQSPIARVSVRITERLRWNAGYQYYNYRQKFFSNQNYFANTGYTSLLWSF
jgi:hypothetical protein